MDDEKIFTKLKDEYDHIPIPLTAKDRVTEGITMAKRQRRKSKMIKFGRNTGLTAAAAVLAITIVSNLNPAAALAMEGIPVIGAVVKVVTFRTFEDTNKNFEANIQIPKVSLNDQENRLVNQSIEEYAQKLINQYENELAAEQGQGHYSLTSTYDVVTDNERYLCLRIKSTESMGSSAQYIKIFTIDKITGKLISLNDLYQGQPGYIKTISDEIKRQMKEQMAADENVIYFYGMEEDYIDQFDQIDGSESFYFNENGELVITFDEYTVAPGYMGAVSFTIPKTITGNLS